MRSHSSHAPKDAPARRRAEGTRGKNHDGGAAVAISKPNMRTLLRAMGRSAVFSFLYLKKIKTLKIYVRFEKFRKYTPVAHPRGDMTCL